MSKIPANPNRHDSRVRILPLVDQHLDYYIDEISTSLPDAPGIHMQKNDVVTEIVMNFLAEKGHWPPKWANDGEGIDLSKRVEDTGEDIP